MPQQLREHRLIAFNTATASENKIHDDEMAQKLGFTGGLVPGVDLFAYLCHVPVREWGVEWLERGAIAARFERPVYEGDEVVIRSSPANPSEGTWLETLATPSAPRAASAIATPPSASAGPVSAAPAAALPSDRPVASPLSLAAGTTLGTLEFGFHADKAAPYLDDIRESLPIYVRDRIAHPGWLLRFANYVLAANVGLGPWIHTESTVRFHGLVHDGDRVSCRARVIEEREHKGHRFVDLDVGFVVNDDTPVMTVDHTAIYRPRQLGPSEPTRPATASSPAEG